ncbi:MAG: hypothetical protein RLZZ324_709, partial [Candidatus Parcubacteria bacterium]
SDGVGTNAPTVSAPHGDVSVNSQALSGGNGYIHNFFIRYIAGWWIYGDHSAAMYDTYTSSGTWVVHISTRNHGLEADDPRMANSYLCPRAFYNRANQFLPIQPWLSSDTALQGDAGGCSTSYGLLSGQHVCNDDSIVMRDIAVSNAVIYNHSTCYDSITAFAPSCY